MTANFTEVEADVARAAERHADLVRPCRLPFAEEDGNRNPSFLGAVFSTRMIS
jgi:hypothetical protein